MQYFFSMITDDNKMCYGAFEIGAAFRCKHIIYEPVTGKKAINKFTKIIYVALCFQFENHSPLSATTGIIFPRSRQQRGKLIHVVGNNGDNLSAL